MKQQQTVEQLFLEDSAELLRQSICKLDHCLSQLSDEQIWWRPFPQANSIGNLILHVCGNLRQWIMAGIGGQPDERDRESEFANDIALSAEELRQHLHNSVDTCLDFVAGVTPQQLMAEYRIQGFPVNGLQAINHTVTHFVGHTHQIIYITRLQLGDQYRFGWSPGDGRQRLPI